MQITELPANLAPSANPERGGINLSFGSTRNPQALIASPQWRLAGWTLQFALLPASEALEAAPSSARVYAKVITGTLEQPKRRPYATPFEVRSTRLQGEVRAGASGALVAIFTEAANAPTELGDMSEVVFQGPMAEELPFVHFHERFNAVTDFFRDADAYMTSGIHLLDEHGEEIANVIFWTAGKGVGLSTHNHGHDPSATAPAFAEVHWVMANGTGSGGMYLCDAQDAEPRQRFPMQRGDEHGPFFHIDGTTQRPRLKDNGAVDYPWHGWEAGTNDEQGQAYDLVCAFEITAPYASLA
ncbi:MAG: hypothetical protein ACR2PZ_11785 [Pseudomonadales bacterium]